MGKRKALYLPASAVVRDENHARVFKVGPESKIVAIDVTTGRTKDDLIEIVDGLDERSEVVEEELSHLKVGQLVDSSAHEQEAESPGGSTESN